MPPNGAMVLLCRWTKSRTNKQLHEIALHGPCADWPNSICSHEGSGYSPGCTNVFYEQRVPGSAGADPLLGLSKCPFGDQSSPFC